MGGNLSVQSGGARPIKVIKDEIAVEEAKNIQDDALLERLSAELDAARAQKNELESAINLSNLEHNDARTAELTAELNALVADDVPDVEENSASVSTLPNNTNEGDKERVANENVLNDETRAKLEKCKERPEMPEGEDEKTVEETKESIRCRTGRLIPMS